MNRLNLIWLVVACSMLVGCASSSATSTVNVDGSWSRTLKLTENSSLSLGDDQKAGQTKPSVFSMPSGSEWSRTEEVKPESKVVTLKRSFGPGEGPITDIILREKETTKLKNFVMVRKLEGNKLEYYEKIVFLTPNGEKQQKDMADFINEMKKAMPTGKATDDDYKALAKKSGIALVRMLVGPDDHLFGTMILNPDGAVRRLRSKFGMTESKILAEQMGDRMTQTERDEVVKKMMKSFDNSTMLGSKKPGSSPDQSSQSAGDLIGMSVSVSLPGKILETNGEIDTFTGEVFWDFASASAEGDVLELRAICQL